MAGSLEVVHVLPQRVRLRWADALDGAALDHLEAQLACQSWLRAWRRRDGSRSLVLLLQPGCPLLRWQLAMAALGWQLDDPRTTAQPPRAQAADPWTHISRQLGGSMIGAALGQVLVGGGAATAAAALAGPPAALLFGGLGAVVGAVLGSIAGSAVADGQARTLPDTLGQLTWRKLSTRMGEEAGSSTGMALGAALAGPAGALAGLAVGSMVGGQLASDLTGPASARRSIGQGRWFVGMVRDTSAETLSQSLASRLGSRLTGGSEVGRELGSALGLRFGRRVDWNASLHRHHLVPLQPPVQSQSQPQSTRQEGCNAPSASS